MMKKHFSNIPNRRKRITIGFNDEEYKELEHFKAIFGITDNNKAVKVAISTAKNYLINVTDTFFPKNYQVVLLKKTKQNSEDCIVYGGFK